MAGQGQALIMIIIIRFWFLFLQPADGTSLFYLTAIWLDRGEGGATMMTMKDHDSNNDYDDEV